MSRKVKVNNTTPAEGELFGEEHFESITPRPVSDSDNAEPETEHENDEEHETTRFDSLFMRLSESDFRSRFHLKDNDIEYISKKGMAAIRLHAEDFIAKRLAAEHLPNDGRQTPMRGHPVFVAQHATGCCCRGCLEKWHGIDRHHPLSDIEQLYIADVITEWIKRDMKRHTAREEKKKK